MKKQILFTVFILAIGSASYGQSKSYLTLKEKFLGHKNVFSLKTSGFLTRTVLLISGDHEFNKAIRDVKKIRLTVIPKAAFRAEKVTLDGFIKIAKKDSFEELAQVRDHGDEVTLLQQSAKKTKHNRYLLLVESSDEVIAMEITGYIDHERMLEINKNQNAKYHYQKT